MRNFFLASGFFLAVVMCTGCKHMPSSLGDTISPSTVHLGDGSGKEIPPELLRVQVQKNDTVDETGIGPLRLGHPVNQTRCLGFTILERGGIGRRLRLLGWDGDIYIIEANSRITDIEVSGNGSEGWVGATEKGIKIGITQEEFRRKYPEAEHSLLNGGWVVGKRTFKFDMSGRLSKIKIGTPTKW